MSRTRLAAIAVCLVAPSIFACGACAIGEEEEPGCREDVECAEGFVCRGGACFRITTSLSPPRDPGVQEDAGGSEGAPEQG